MTESLQRPQRGMSRFEWEGGVEFHLPHGERIEVLRQWPAEEIWVAHKR